MGHIRLNLDLYGNRVVTVYDRNGEINSNRNDNDILFENFLLFAVAINGVMIFNPTPQDGIYCLDSDPYLIGEWDACGGHSGRGDDYHYHISPVCLIDELADESDGTLPMAYAMIHE